VTISLENGSASVIFTLREPENSYASVIFTLREGWRSVKMELRWPDDGHRSVRWQPTEAGLSVAVLGLPFSLEVTTDTPGLMHFK